MKRDARYPSLLTKSWVTEDGKLERSNSRRCEPRNNAQTTVVQKKAIIHNLSFENKII